MLYTAQPVKHKESNNDIAVINMSICRGRDLITGVVCDFHVEIKSEL